MKILVTGSTAYDLLLTYDGSFTDSIDMNALEDFSVGFVTPHYARHFGGTGANIAWGLSILGQDPLLVSTVGKDGSPYVELMRERGIGTDYIEHLDKYMTATAVIGSDAQEHQITFFHPGADAHGTWPDISCEKEIRYAIVSPRDASVMADALRWCAKSGVPTMFDPGQQIGTFSDDDLMRGIKSSTGIVANAYEWDQISSRLGLSVDEAMELVSLVVITKGEDGLVVHSRENKFDIPACPTKRVINPTGAGDALRAGLLTGLSLGWSPVQCGRLGAAMGSFAVEEEGTLMEKLTAKDVLDRAEKTYGSPLPAME